jgi:hypothetical protein
MVKKMPVGVKLVSILAYALAAVMLISGVVTLIGGTFLAGMVDYMKSIPGYEILSGLPLGTLAVTLVFFIIFILLAILYFFIGKGLMKGENRARVVMIVLMAIGAIDSLATLPMYAVNLIVNVVVIAYLSFFKEAKAYFK